MQPRLKSVEFFTLFCGSPIIAPRTRTGYIVVYRNKIFALKNTWTPRAHTRTHSDNPETFIVRSRTDGFIYISRSSGRQKVSFTVFKHIRILRPNVLIHFALKFTIRHVLVYVCVCMFAWWQATSVCLLPSRFIQ